VQNVVSFVHNFIRFTSSVRAGFFVSSELTAGLQAKTRGRLAWPGHIEARRAHRRHRVLQRVKRVNYSKQDVFARLLDGRFCRLQIQTHHISGQARLVVPYAWVTRSASFLRRATGEQVPKKRRAAEFSHTAKLSAPRLTGCSGNLHPSASTPLSAEPHHPGIYRHFERHWSIVRNAACC
jgi:hypothetical protein